MLRYSGDCFKSYKIKKEEHMIFSNFHTHCFYCDGHESPENFVKEALRLGFDAIGFSSHAPLPHPNDWTMKSTQVPEYCETINDLKNLYKGRIEIYLGLETDYIPDKIGPDSPEYEKLGLDYTIGSVHQVLNNKTGEYLSVDGSLKEFQMLLDDVFNGDISRFTAHYYHLIRQMLTAHKPDIIGHLDLIKKHNRDEKYFSETEEWYRLEIDKTLEAIANSGLFLEVNTGGISRKYINTPYPSPWIIKRCSDFGIPIVLNSDAHSPSFLNTYFVESIEILKGAGYRSIKTMKGGKWIDRQIG